MTSETIAIIVTQAGEPPAWWLTENPQFVTPKQQWRQWRLYLLTNLQGVTVTADPRHQQILDIAVAIKVLVQPNLPQPLAQQVFDSTEQIRVRAAALVLDSGA